MSTRQKTVFVSGCFDLLHSGHIAFFQAAAKHGHLMVAVGSDRTIFELKGRPPLTSEEERLYMIRSVESVHEAFISEGRGMLDFEKDLARIHPDVFIVNADGDIPEKRALCASLDVSYRVLAREPHRHFKPRSTTALRNRVEMPYRLDLAGGWLDQPFISKMHAGPVITISLEPFIEFNERSGMASSTRRTAMDLWGPVLPVDDPQKLARILFCCENPPGSKYISGSQDAIGLTHAGLAKSDYSGEYWPCRIESLHDETVIQFVENHIFLKPMGPRAESFDIMQHTHFTTEAVKKLSDASSEVWRSLQEKDPRQLGDAVRRSFEAQISLFPSMCNSQIESVIHPYREEALGWKLSGAGGGGYLVIVSETQPRDTVRLVVRRP
ncbi:adenylyltransferase/cytidyltransferase family protein [bacterium]|jgi:cytidyltransferase-like protein|nr:adenylyltransferase/cytidyltransferase family protein [bacterium]MDG1891477.1 adenylyltransferase/cytidyltransferase family protein [Verrucomicrobiota bacterium]